MTDLTQAIADVKAQIDENLPYSMISDDPLRIAENTILNAVASGELIPLAEVRAFTVSDGQRLLQKRDVAGVCDDPDLCFENVGSTARCGPCAAKLAAKAGIELNQYTASNPQAMRLQRELAATQAKLIEWQSLQHLVEALSWYGEQARLCRLIHSEGDLGRQALGKDGGKLARAAIEGAKP